MLAQVLESSSETTRHGSSSKTRDMNKRIYINPRPSLVIENTGGGSLGNCYASMSYRVTSRKPLDLAALTTLREIGFLGYGQEFYASLVAPDGPAKRMVPGSVPTPSGVDVVQCSEVDHAGKVVACPSTNPYSGVLDAAHEEPFYQYLCESRVDSSD